MLAAGHRIDSGIIRDTPSPALTNDTVTDAGLAADTVIGTNLDTVSDSLPHTVADPIADLVTDTDRVTDRVVGRVTDTVTTVQLVQHLRRNGSHAERHSQPLPQTCVDSWGAQLEWA